MLKKKSLAQVFLKDNNVINNIIKELEIILKDTSDYNLIEIGPGGGALTEKIYKFSYKNLYLIEKDQRLIETLNNRYKNVEIINADATKINYSNFLDANTTNILISNLPYYASSKILSNIIKQYPMITKMLLMFQKELADRIIASPNTKEYSRISILAEEFYEVEKKFNVSPKSFKPEPKVDSSVLYFKARLKPLINPIDRKIYEQTIEKMFQHRRKKIAYFFNRNNFDSSSLDIDLNKRVGELDIYALEKIANYLSLKV